MPDSSESQRVTIFDTTLRDGEQAPGASMNLAEKLKVAAALQMLRVDVIEAGFPAASPGDFESVQAIARKVRGGISICALARCTRADIERAWEALRDAERPRVHVFLATSPIHREHKLKLSRAEVVRRAVEAVGIARSRCDDVEFSAEDASRTEPEFLVEVVERVLEAGATTVNIPDTVGYALPAEYAETIAMLKRTVRGIERAVLSVHCHDDLGLAVANSLAAAQAGARQIECTVNGVGERAGNCSLEEVVMAMRTRAASLQLHSNVRTTQLHAASRTVSRATGFAVQRNKAIVGDNAFAHEAGIHQHGMLQHPSTYEIMRPEDVGFRNPGGLVLGKHSGRHSLRQRLEQLGYQLEEAELETVFGHFKTLADRKKEIFDGDLETLIDGLKGSSSGRWELVSIQATSGTGSAPSAAVCLQQRGGKQLEDAAVGDGPVDAVFKSIERIAGVKVKLRNFQVRNMTPGEDAQGEVHIEVDHEGRSYRGRGVSTDIVVASAHAFLEVVNRIAAVRPRAAAAAAAEEEVRCGAV